MMDIENIIKQLNIPERSIRRRTFNSVNWSMDEMLGLVCRIGQRLDPRFVLDADNIAVYENLVYWIMCDERMRSIDPRSGAEMAGRLDKGIYLAGNTGSGKSTAMRIAKILYPMYRFRTHDDKEILWLERRADEIASYFSEKGEIRAFREAPLLCIQDLGCEPIEVLYMGNRVKILQNIIEYRGDCKENVTMVTSNIPLTHEDFRTRYGQRAASRMLEMTNYLILSGTDRRQNF